jgi:hypothetical protein
MNSCINYSGDSGMHSIMCDLSSEFCHAPYHSINFEIDAAGIQKLADHFSDQVFRTAKWFEQDKLSWTSLLLRFNTGVFLVAHGDGRDSAEIIGPGPEQVSNVHKEVRQVLSKDKPSETPAFYMLRYDYSSFSADPIENLPDSVNDDFLQLCYGDDIIDWVAQFRERTLERAGGLTILDGPPGTGKTSLISQMIRRLEQTHVFYSLPTCQHHALSSPELVPFWQKQNARHAERVKVIVMEDAERLLWCRTGDNREAVSALLNIADGLLGRMLRLHVVCSVNAPMEDLDPAVLRPGRLMNHRRFDPITRDTAERIAKSRQIEFRPRKFSERYTLAEVLNPGSYEPPQTRPRIGFQNRNEN